MVPSTVRLSLVLGDGFAGSGRASARRRWVKSRVAATHAAAASIALLLSGTKASLAIATVPLDCNGDCCSFTAFDAAGLVAGGLSFGPGLLPLFAGPHACQPGTGVSISSLSPIRLNLLAACSLAVTRGAA